MVDNVKPYPQITQAIRDGALGELTALLEMFPEMVALDVPAFGTWLHFAAAHGTPEIAEYLVGRGFDPDSRNNREGTSPATEAATHGNTSILTYLIAHGARLDTSSAIQNPLFGAILAKSYGTAEVLLNAGIDTQPSYTLGSTRPPADAIAFAMLHGQHAIAHLIASARASDAQSVEAMLAEGLRTAHAISAPSDDA